MSEAVPQRPPGPSGLAAALIVKLRFFIVAFWVVAAVLLTVELPSIREAQTGAVGDLVPKDASALDAELRSSKLFRFPLLSRVLVVQRDRDGLSAIEQARVARRAAAINRGRYPELRRVGGALPITNALGRPPFSRERSTTAITYLYFAPDVSRDDRQILAERFINRRIKPDYEGFVGTTGTISARAEQASLMEDSLPLVETATLLLVLLVVGIHFRAVGAPLVNLGAVAIAYLVSIRLIAWIGQRLGISVPSEVQPVVVVLLFGVVTDYSIFFMSRIRRRMADGDEAREAAVRGTAELLPIIFVAGITVVAATASLVVAELGFFKAFGPGMAMAILIGLMVALTLVPAVLGIGGRWLFWPRRPGIEATLEQAAEETPTEERGRPRRTRAVRLATRRPVATAVVCGALLLASASGLLRIEVGNPLIRGLPDESSPREGYVMASRGFAPGILSPTVIIVEGQGITRERRKLARLQRRLAHRSGVARVVGPADQPTDRAFGAVLSRTGAAARYFVVLRSDPLGARAIEDLRRIRAGMPVMLRDAGLSTADVGYAGDTALVEETIDKTVTDTRRVTPAAIAVVVLVLAVFLRALVAPFYLVLVALLGLAASLGIAVYVFQGILGHQEITYYVPFAAAVLLLSLGSDYNVFLVGRIWAEARRRPLPEAVSVAGARAAAPITIAGLVLAASFAVLALVPVRPFAELALTMAAGLLIDALLVRTLLVPALITLVGYRSGWPGARLRPLMRSRGG